MGVLRLASHEWPGLQQVGQGVPVGIRVWQPLQIRFGARRAIAGVGVYALLGLWHGMCLHAFT
jgi:hypothetical protein